MGAPVDHIKSLNEGTDKGGETVFQLMCLEELFQDHLFWINQIVFILDWCTDDFTLIGFTPTFLKQKILV